jgi:putative addiction module CopG family antidote
MMTMHLPEDLQRYVQTEVQSGRFASPDEAISDALRLHRQKKQEAQSPRKALTPDELNRQLLEAGLLSQIPARPDPVDYQEFSTIAIEGEPLSETIIRERR